MTGCMIAEQWPTTLSPPVRLRENRDVGHGGTVAPIAVNNGGQSGRMRFFTHTPAFLLANLWRVSAPCGLPGRIIHGSRRVKLPRPAFWHTVAIRECLSIPAFSDGPRPPLRGLPSLSTPERFPIPGFVPAIQTVAPPRPAFPARRAGSRPNTAVRRACPSKMSFSRHPAGEVFVYINV